jgi:uncharacterized protein
MRFSKKHLPVTLTIWLFTFFLLATNIVAQNNAIPAKPSPPRLVNDLANFLTPGEQNQLEQKLIAIDDSSSVQIVIVTLKSLNGYDINTFGPEMIRSWGIGQKGKNNGILIIIKPQSTNEKGEIAISTGYGVEAVVTDAISKQIIDQVIIPSFKTGKYYQGLDEAVNTLYKLSKGEFPANLTPKNKKKHNKSHFPIGAIVVLVLIAIAIFGNRGGGSHSMSSGGGLPFWLLMTTMMSGRSGGGGFGNFSDGDGDFGGFGGGDGGGGGASGSW